MKQPSPDTHLGPEEIASYVDGAMHFAARSRVESHLAACDDCRADVAEVSLMRAQLRARRRRSFFWIPVGAAAAAGIIFLMMSPGVQRTNQRREGPATAASSPQPIAPVGLVDSLTEVRWSSIPEADRYEVRVFDSLGTVLWQQETTDTTARLPASLSLRAAVQYYWRVEASTGFGRAVQSEMVGFSLRIRRVP